MVYPHTYRTEHSETKTTSSNYGHYYAQQQSSKIHIQDNLLKILQFIDSNRKQFIQDLDDAVQIKSISLHPDYRDEILKMKKFVENWLIKLGMKYECFNIGHEDDDETKPLLPPVILGQLHSKRADITICVYCHVDVNKPDKAKWNTDPWKVVEGDKIIYGNGVSWGKGDLMCWFHVIEAFRKSNIELPVNLHFIIECLNRQGSMGLADFLMTRKQDFLSNIDYVVVTESEWLGDKHPCISFGCPGMIHYKISMQKGQDSKTEIEDDLNKVFSYIADSQSNILIPRLDIYVQQITPDEEQIYRDIAEFNIDEIRNSLPECQRDWDKVKLLMHFWRLPSISVEDVEVCTCPDLDTTKIQRQFVMKIVPNQIIDRQISHVCGYVNEMWEKMNSKNIMKIEVTDSSRPWLEDCRSPNYEAARRASIQIYKEDPSMIREDRHLDCVSILHKIIEKNILVLPLGNKNINAGKENENMTLRNMYEGTKLLAAYLFQAAKKPKKSKV